MKYDVHWVHFTGQSHHNKVKYHQSSLCKIFFQDWVDGEFSRVKTKLAQHLHQHEREVDGYYEVLDSSSLCKFGQDHLSTPGKNSGIERRTFFELEDAVIKERSTEVKLSFKKETFKI